MFRSMFWLESCLWAGIGFLYGLLKPLPSWPLKAILNESLTIFFGSSASSGSVNYCSFSLIMLLKSWVLLLTFILDIIKFSAYVGALLMPLYSSTRMFTFVRTVSSAPTLVTCACVVGSNISQRSISSGLLALTALSLLVSPWLAADAVLGLIYRSPFYLTN